MDPSDPRARDLRVSDAEREHVGGLLQRAVGHGMLSLGEFSERMDSVLAAKTRGELNAVLIDLPGMSIAGQTPDQAPVPPPAPQMYTPPTYPAAPAYPTVPAYPTASAHPPADIRATMSTVTRSGSWRVPPAIRVASKMATVTLDFTSAVLSSPVVRIDVDDYCSTITLVVPDGASVDFGGLVLIGGSAKNRLGSRPVQGALHVSVHGRVRFGSVTAKHSLGTAIRKMFG